jgi:hypothetical protein
MKAKRLTRLGHGCLRILGLLVFVILIPHVRDQDDKIQPFKTVSLSDCTSLFFYILANINVPNEKHTFRLNY